MVEKSTARASSSASEDVRCGGVEAVVGERVALERPGHVAELQAVRSPPAMSGPRRSRWSRVGDQKNPRRDEDRHDETDACRASAKQNATLEESRIGPYVIVARTAVAADSEPEKLDAEVEHALQSDHRECADRTCDERTIPAIDGALLAPDAPPRQRERGSTRAHACPGV